MSPSPFSRLTRRAAVAALASATATLFAGLRSRPAAATAPAVFLQTTDIAGTQYYRALELAGRLRPGDPLRLHREPQNPHDELAIEVFTSDGAKLGYVPRMDNAPYARLMDAGRTISAEVAAIDHGRSRFGGWGFIEMRLFLDGR